MQRRNTSRLFVFFALGMLLSGCVATEETVDSEWAAALAEFQAELRNDFPFRAGMTIEEVVKTFNTNNKRVNALMDEDFRKNRELGIFQPPLYADPDLHLYVYVDLFGTIGEANDTTKAIAFWVNGRNQFWVEMQIDHGKVSSIFITPGNMSVRDKPFLYDGKGEYVGHFAEPAECK